MYDVFLLVDPSWKQFVIPAQNKTLVAEKYCSDCEEKLCTECAEWHLRCMTFRYHVIDLSSVRSRIPRSSSRLSPLFLHILFDGVLFVA